MQSKLDAMNLPLEDIKVTKNNPRQNMDKAALEELALSIRTMGILEPLVVRRSGKEYELVAGHRRIKAAKLAGLKVVPVVVHEIDDDQVKQVMIIENLQREGLSPMEEAVAIDTLVRDGHKVKDLAKTLGKCDKWVNDRIKLLQFPDDLKAKLTDGSLNVSAVVQLFPFLPSTSFIAKVDREVCKDTRHTREEDEPITEKHIRAAIEHNIESATFVVKKEEYDWKKMLDLTDCNKCKKPISYKMPWGEKKRICLDKVCYQPKIIDAKKKYAEKKPASNSYSYHNKSEFMSDAVFDISSCLKCKDFTPEDKENDECAMCNKPKCFSQRQAYAEELMLPKVEAARKELETKLDAYLAGLKVTPIDRPVMRILFARRHHYYDGDDLLELAKDVEMKKLKSFDEAIEKAPVEKLILHLVKREVKRELPSGDVDVSDGESIEDCIKNFPEIWGDVVFERSVKIDEGALAGFKIRKAAEDKKEAESEKAVA